MKLPELFIDRSSAQRPCIEQDGRAMDLEAVFKTGFIVRPDDCPAMMTLLMQFLQARDEFTK